LYIHFYCFVFPSLVLQVLLFMVNCLESGYWNSISKISILSNLSLLQLYYNLFYISELHLVMGHTIFISLTKRKIWGDIKIPYVSLCYNRKKERKEIRFSTLYCKTVMLLIDLIFDPCFFFFIVATYYLPISSEKSLISCRYKLLDIWNKNSQL